MTQKIKFIALDEYGFNVHPRPFPASTAVPQWWRDATPYGVDEENPEGKKLIIRNGKANATFKKCVPMLDAITSGYFIPLFADVQVSWKENIPEINWRIKGSSVFQLHGTSSRDVPPPPGYSKFVFKYLNTWIPKTPPGYSVLVTSPLGYRGLPFHTIPAIIDTDKSSLDFTIPMWLKEGFEGIVEKGTPLVQITPFKRDAWKSEFDFYKNGEYHWLTEREFNSTLVNHYIKKHWSKKTYK